MQRQILLQPAFILHTKPYLNSSLIVTIFTKEYGLLKLIAKGARRMKSKLRSQLQFFIEVKINYLNKQSIGLLLDVDQCTLFNKLSADKLTYGLYMNEIIIKLLHEHDPHPKLFNIYREALAKLMQTGNIEKALREFEILMLQELGYGIDFFNDARYGNNINPEQRYLFNAEYGFEKISEEATSKRTFMGVNILEIGKIKLINQQILQDAKYILRTAIASRLGREQINSRKLIIS